MTAEPNDDHSAESDKVAAFASFAQNRGIAIKAPRRPRPETVARLDLVGETDPASDAAGSPPAIAEETPVPDDAAGPTAARFGTRRYGKRAVDTTLSVTLAKKVKDAARVQGVSRGEILIEAIRTHHKAVSESSPVAEELEDDPFAGLGTVRGRAKVAEGGVSVKLQFYIPPAFAARIAVLAEELAMTPSAYMRAALEAWARR